MNGSTAHSSPTLAAREQKFSLAKSLLAVAVGYIFLLIFLMASSYLEGPPYEAASTIRLLTMGLCMAIVGLLASSTALVGVHWPKRLAGLLVGAAAVSAVLVGLFDWPKFYLWQLLVELLVEIVVLLIVLIGAQRLGYRLRRDPLASLAWGDSPQAMQHLSILDLFILVTSFALVFAALRPLQPTEQNWFSLALIACGLLCATISLIAIWSALSSAPIFVRGLALLIPGPLAALGYWITTQYQGWLLYSAAWYAYAATVQTLFMLLPLAIVRRHGYRLRYCAAIAPPP